MHPSNIGPVSALTMASSVRPVLMHTGVTGGCSAHMIVLGYISTCSAAEKTTTQGARGSVKGCHG